MLKWLKRYVDGGQSSRKTSSAQLEGPLDLTDAETIANFKSTSRTLRDRCPVCPVTSGGVLLLRPNDVKAAFSNKLLSNQPSRFSALAPKNKDKYVAASVASNIPPFLDAPQHIEIRRWLSRSFFERYKSFEPEIDSIAQDHADKVGYGTHQLLVEEIARNFVVDAIGQFVGIEITPDEMKEFTGALFRLFAPAADAEIFAQTNLGLANARRCLITTLHERRADQKECLLNLLDQTVDVDLEGSQKDTLIADNTLLILADGVENVEAAIANVLMSAQKDNVDITTDQVRSVITSDTPGQTIARIASQNMTIGEESISAGTPVFLSLASANDGSDASEDFSFGMGRHKCIGEQLALAMITSFCQALSDLKPQIDASGLHYAPMFGHKWPRGVTLSLSE